MSTRYTFFERGKNGKYTNKQKCMQLPSSSAQCRTFQFSFFREMIPPSSPSTPSSFAKRHQTITKRLRTTLLLLPPLRLRTFSDRKTAQFTIGLSWKRGGKARSSSFSHLRTDYVCEKSNGTRCSVFSSEEMNIL